MEMGGEIFKNLQLVPPYYLVPQSTQISGIRKFMYGHNKLPAFYDMRNKQQSPKNMAE